MDILKSAQVKIGGGSQPKLIGHEISKSLDAKMAIHFNI